MGVYAEIWTGETTEISGVTIQHNEVIEVIVVDQCNYYLITGHTISGVWVKTCPQCWIRKNYAGKGMIYDEENDMFIKKQPYPSWSANTETGQWDPPTPKPTDGLPYEWNENTLSWDETPMVSPSPTPSVTITPSVTPTPGLSPTPTPSSSPIWY